MKHSGLILQQNNAIIVYMLTYEIYTFVKHIKRDKTVFLEIDLRNGYLQL